MKETQSALGGSAVGTIALVRQVGTTLAPAILVSFIANTGGMEGYQQMLLCVAVFCMAALVAIAPYRSPKKAEKK